jgi:hypothetical protein
VKERGERKDREGERREEGKKREGARREIWLW